MTEVTTLRPPAADLRAELARHLEEHGLTLARAARGIGMSAPAVSSWIHHH